MRAAVLLVLGLAAIASARPDNDDVNFVSMDIKQKQLFILKLLNHVTEPVMYKDVSEIGMNFKIEDNMELYTKTEVVKSFVNMLKVGVLPRGEVFTLNVDRQMKEVVNMFHILYYAKDFSTFIKTACWMRLYLNEGMFVYSLSVAVRYREDCKGVVLPPPYEIYPYYFVRADVIQKAYLIKMRKGLLDLKLSEFYGIKKTEKDVYIIDENVYDRRVALNEDDKIKYFTEDIDLNTYYYYFHVDYPFWMKDQIFDKLKTRRFELTLYIYQQILARYYLERLSNGLGEIPEFSFYKPIQQGYWPWLKLHNGIELPARFNNYVSYKYDNTELISLVEEYETLIKEAIMKGYIDMNGIRLELTKPEDIETLGKMIYGKVAAKEQDSKCVEAYRYLLIVMKSAIGLNTLESDKYFVAPTVLDSYQTALRDPVFYQLQKRLVNIVQLFKKRLPCYTKEELYFPGVKIENVVVDKLLTYFDDYFMDMTNAVTLSEEEIKKASASMGFLVRKRRLNHEPFKVSLEILSDKAVDCVVRIFMGPKEDQLGRLIDINKNRLNFVEMDSFVYKLTTGKNTIVRKSSDMHNLVPDRMMTSDLWKKVESITDMRDLFVKDLKNYFTGFPTRLLLPKGSVSGLPMVMYVMVSPLKLVDNVDMSAMLDPTSKALSFDFRSTVLMDKMPLGFPLDRYIDVTNFYTSNMKFVDVTIFHKNQSCDMKMRWDKWVLKSYNLASKTPIESNTYFVDTDLNSSSKVESSANVYDM
uniref:Moderately methionine rich hexamerin n=1 Tax=Hyalophora cecropia TaxID=7123 RepID=O17480_HYACE|nr:moderately methionine rich hexamerin precursor [Hyalophora cecropia]